MEESRTLLSIKNFLTGFLQKLVSLLLIFVCRRFFIVYIGIDYLGINSLFVNILSILSMADFGFGISMAYSFYKPIAENDKSKISALITFYGKIYNIIALTILVVGLGLIPFLKFLINLEHEIPNLYIYYIVFLLQTVISYLFVYKGTLLNANQKSYIINGIYTIINVIKTIIQIVSIILFKKYIVFILIQLFANLLQNLIISYKANKLFPYIKEKRILDKESKIQIRNNISSIFIYKVSSVFMNSIDSILISKLVSTTVLGIYSNYLEILNGLFTFLNIIFSSVTASIGNLVVTESEDKQIIIFKTMQMLSYFFSTFVIICFITTVQDFITIWIGNSFLLNYSIVICVSINFYFSICSMPLWSYREACGIYMKTKYIMLLCAIINLCLSIFLGIKFGLSGIIIASVIARLLTYLWYEPKILYNIVFKESPIKYYLGFARNIIITVICCVVTYVFYSNIFVTESSIINFIIKNLINFIFILILFFILYHKTNEFKYLINTFKRIFRRF